MSRFMFWVQFYKRTQGGSIVHESLSDWPLLLCVWAVGRKIYWLIHDTANLLPLCYFNVGELKNQLSLMYILFSSIPFNILQYHYFLKVHLSRLQTSLNSSRVRGGLPGWWGPPRGYICEGRFYWGWFPGHRTWKREQGCCYYGVSDTAHELKSI